VVWVVAATATISLARASSFMTVLIARLIATSGGAGRVSSSARTTSLGS